MFLTVLGMPLDVMQIEIARSAHCVHVVALNVQESGPWPVRRDGLRGARCQLLPEAGDWPVAGAMYGLTSGHVV